MTRWIAALSLPLTLALAGCDSEPEAADERAAQEEVDDSARHHGKRSPTDRLCAKIECSDGQEAALGELFAKHRPAKDERKAHHEARRAEMKALGEAFVAGSLTAEQLEAHHQGMEKKMGELGRSGLFVELHALLTPEQRAVLADAIEHRGLHVLGGKGRHGKHGKRGKKGKRGEHGEHGDGGEQDKPCDKGEGDEPCDKGERGAHDGPGPHGLRGERMVSMICDKAECTDAQRSTLEAKAEALHSARKAHREGSKDAHMAAKARVAEAFRGESFGASDVEAFMGSMKALKGSPMAEIAPMVLEVQTLFTAEQRAIIVETMEAMGPMGKHGKRGKRGKRGKHGEKGEQGPDAE